jgi:hypothetical protein
VDVSAPAIARAVSRPGRKGSATPRSQHADAQTHRFPPERFDLAMSRFGTMFFADRRGTSGGRCALPGAW